MTRNYEIVSEWRKGLAIGRYETRSSQSYKNQIVYELLSEKAEKPLIISSYTRREYIHRSIDGRYFATAMVLCNPITYPGQDRDTEYDVHPCILYVLDENGDYIKENGRYIKTENDIYSYVDKNPLKYSIELGNGLVLYADKTYNTSSNTFHSFSPLDYIQKLKKREYSRGDEYDLETRDYNFLRYLSYKNTRETEDGEILCGSSVYDVNNCELLFSIPKQIEPLGKFEDGMCKVGIVSDYRDFIVITSNARIVKIYEAKQLGLMSDFLNAIVEDPRQLEDVKQHELLTNLLLNSVSNIKERKSVDTRSNKGVFKLPDGAKVNRILTIEEEIEIEKYLIRFPSEYDMWNGEVPLYNDKFGIMKYHSKHDATKYFELAENRWYEITGENGKQIDKLIFDIECNRPNYIKDIKRVKQNIQLNGSVYSIYKFECRPVGYITENGSLIYDFDIENIEW